MTDTPKLFVLMVLVVISLPAIAAAETPKDQIPNGTKYADLLVGEAAIEEEADNAEMQEIGDAEKVEPPEVMADDASREPVSVERLLGEAQLILEAIVVEAAEQQKMLSESCADALAVIDRYLKGAPPARSVGRQTAEGTPVVPVVGPAGVSAAAQPATAGINPHPAGGAPAAPGKRAGRSSADSSSGLMRLAGELHMIASELERRARRSDSAPAAKRGRHDD